MSRTPLKLPPADSELARLVESFCDGTITPAEGRRLESLLAGDREAQLFYVAYLDLHAQVQWMTRGDGNDVPAPAIGATVELPVDAAVELPDQLGVELPDEPDVELSNEVGAPAREPLIPPIVIHVSPFSPPPSFVGGWAFSYGVATLLTGVAVLISSVWKVSHDYQLAPNSPPPTPMVRKNAKPEIEYVGRITGTADCRWAGPQGAPSAAVPLGRKYELASGLVEIAYDSGARIILQGPCTYEVESAAGGFLSLGKLTARVEKKNEVGSGQWAMGSEAKSQDHYPLATSHYPLFVVRTPTAVVTDLGTEFGVEVSKEGTTTSHVFRGTVRVELAAGGSGPRTVVLRQSESARVESGKSAGGPRLVLPGAVGRTPGFVRWLVEPPKLLDLLDIVAGGDGTGHRRERGIDPTTGMEDPVFRSSERGGDRQYRPVAWHKFIDGVFVPDGGAGPVVLDSAGHTFDGFPKTSGVVFGSIWARAADVPPQYREYRGNGYQWIFAIGRPQQFMPEGRGLLGFCANVGMTLNLEALRKMHRGTRPARFRAVAGLADARQIDPNPDGMADIWVLVDGRLKLKRMHLRPQDGTVNVDVELGPSDRFLTLVSTDGGNGIGNDWVVFGDPVLQMASTEPEDSGEEHR
jgi:hypothetical protein